MGSRLVGQAFRKINNKMGSRHKKAWKRKVNAKSGKTGKLGKTSHALPPQTKE